MKINKVIKILIILAIIILGIVIVNYFYIINKPLKVTAPEIVTVDEGDNFYRIINQLSSEHKIRDPIMIKLYTKIKGGRVEILPGQYELQPNMNIKEIINTLQSNSDYNTVKVTIPEGFTIDEIASKLEADGVCTADEFKEAIKLYPLPTYIKNNPEKRYNLEGFLFPDTYTFDVGVTPNEIIQAMLNRFDEVWNEVSVGLNIQENDIENVITVASMIEKEAVVDYERPIIASVIYNRVKVGMPLQIDATVLYAHGYHIDKVYNSHLAIDSLYNTYLYEGLPVGPISNPGEDSIKAALNPENTDYIYYLLENGSNHYFTSDYHDFIQKKEELGY